MGFNKKLAVVTPLLFSSLLVGCIADSNDDKKAEEKSTVISSVKTLDFSAFNDQEAALEAKGLRVFGPNATLAQDLEPEYVTLSKDGKTAWISLQENNGIAKVDLVKQKITDIFGLGFKDHSTAGNELDASDKDGDAFALNTFRNLKGMYQPDGIASFEEGGVTYVVSANEGDGREYAGFEEESRVSKLTLGTAAFPDAAALQDDSKLGRLKVTKNLSSSTAETSFDTLYTFGARSFSIWNGETGKQVFDSGKDLAVKADASKVYPDGRSDAKGTEPENIAIGMVAGKRLAFVGLERANAIAVYDITDIKKVAFKQMLSDAQDIGPEGVLFIAASDSPNGKDLLVISNEISASVTVYQADAAGVFSQAGRVVLTGGEGAAEISTFDNKTKRLFVVNNGEDLAAARIEVINFSDPSAPSVESSIDISRYGGGVNSVSVSNGMVAAAIEANTKTDAGHVVLFDTTTLAYLDKATVGALPDMLTFSPDGKTIITADEGEPNSDYSIDPKGTVSIIQLK